MAEDDGYDDDPLASGTYSQLLFADDDVVGLEDSAGCFNFTSHFSSEKPPKMLCFGDYEEGFDLQSFDDAWSPAATKCGGACSDSSSPVYSNKLSNSNKKRTGSAKESKLPQKSGDDNNGTAPGGNKKTSKKARAESSTLTGHAKVKKEKLGERITALQQIVSPFGKTDTASVLHEAMGYIRFLHDQVQVLSSPYLQRLPPPSATHLSPSDGKVEIEEECVAVDLRSKGLCLVPMELISHVVAETNGADFWSPSMVNNLSPNQ